MNDFSALRFYGLGIIVATVFFATAGSAAAGTEDDGSSESKEVNAARGRPGDMVKVTFEPYVEGTDYWIIYNGSESGEEKKTICKLPCTGTFSPGPEDIAVIGDGIFSKKVTIPRTDAVAKVGWKHERWMNLAGVTMIGTLVAVSFGLGWGIGSGDWKEASLYGFVPAGGLLTISLVTFALISGSTHSFEIEEKKTAKGSKKLALKNLGLSPSPNGGQMGATFTF